MPGIGRHGLLAVALPLIALAAVTRAQTTAEPDTVGSLPGIEINTSVDLAEVYIGDLITYTVTIEYDSTYQLIPPPLGANLGAFDVKDYEPDVETRLQGGRLQSRTTFVLSTFTTGDYTIPPLPVMFMLPDSSRQVLLAEAVPIKVLSLLENAGDSVDIKSLKAQYEFPRDYTPYYLWGGLGLFVVALALAGWLWRRRRKQAAEQVDLRPPWEIAFERLAYLKENYLSDDSTVADQRLKEYYVELTEISRIYLGRMFEANVPEMTTEQFLEVFSEKELPEDLFDRLADFYRHADQVKFARYRPADGRPITDFSFAHDCVEILRAHFEERRQVETQLSAPDDQGQPMVEERPA